MAESSGPSYLTTSSHALLLQLYKSFGEKANFKIETYYEPETGTDVLEIVVLFDGGGKYTIRQTKHKGQWKDYSLSEETIATLTLLLG